MKSFKMFLIVSIPALAVAAFLGRSSAQPVATPASPAMRLAVCDVVAVFNNYQRVKDLNGELTKKLKAIAEEEKKSVQKIRRIEQVLGALRPGSKEYEAKITEYEKLSIELSISAKLKKQAVLRWHLRLTEEMYGEILNVITAVAKQRGCDVVIYRESVDIASQTTPELLNKIAQRKCLYYNPAIDLTDVVLKQINNRYAKSPK